VELDHGIEGMIHISELADRRVGKVEEIVKIDQELSFRVLECNSEQRRIKLSLKAPRQDRTEQGDRDSQVPASPPGKPPKALRKAKGPLKSGLGSHGGLGMGLGDLKL
jgi:ribosomal protein S1